ncbi:cytochrome c-type biogenesis protein CcmF [Chitinophaga dinghuensis]|uniref:Cytochrome c-type biogenesis protein CcmF n=1 Tax=Chitinophaga dinghuensis TaxID=1539050 RepID=A0A327W7Y0_9BACT|nr:cytochrome c biogenesis protein CcsA [Chitinophaga dinghuensis]RAJ82138.1 cytochrome c-type biogenesis protein CcmF [Chitinophaga dinghuensis]
MKFVGEHLLLGQLGHFFAVLAFVASMVASVSYYCAVVNKEESAKASWKKVGRWSFFIQSIAVLAIFCCLFYILYNHFFEYKYAWRNTSRDLPVQYLFSSLWSDQEGSFLLWSIWNSVLGIVLIRTSGKWETPVMTVISISQLMMSSMLLGIFILGYKVGSNPFMLLRQAEENQAAPIFQSAEYLSFIKDGNGLNLTLQNYWMVIHPPVLFLGFASTIVPFAFAFAGIWTRDYTGWTKPVLPWGLFAIAILGLGIMMGAAWAYESLNFGGYWAWDPVENASLVPWLCMVAGVHTCLAYKSTGHALKSTVFFFFISFITILYSTFLTRSGILGDSSVHSFTDLGMSGQLLIFMAVFTVPSIWIMIARRKEIPTVNKEESTYSREFWLFVGALVLLIAAIQITFTTSIPVWNKLLDITGLRNLLKIDQMAPPSDVMFHYNKIQIWLAIIVGILTALVQFMKYKDTPRRELTRKLLLPTAISLVATLAIIFAGGVHFTEYGAGFLAAIYFMLFASIYAVVGNFMYIFIGLKGKVKSAGASIAHVGFGMVLLGALLSSAKKEVISLDKMKMLSQDIFRKESKQNARENIMLPLGVPVEMGEYHATYVGDSSATGDAKVYFKVDYERKDKSGKIVEHFRLYPNAFVNTKENALTSNPSSRHYLDRDIFTYITATPPLKDKNAPADDSTKYVSHEVKPGDSIFFSKGFMILKDINTKVSNRNYEAKAGDLAVGADLEVFTQTDDHFKLQPVYLIRDSAYQYSIEDTLAPLALQVRFSKILPAENKVQIKVKEADSNSDYIIMKAIVFPYINVLWLGVIVMIVGTFIAIAYRVKLNKGGKTGAAKAKEPAKQKV